MASVGEPFVTYPLIGRPPEAVLFRTDSGDITGSGDITAQSFLGYAHALAPKLRDASAVINLCQDRLRFAVAFAASVLNGTVCWLVNDRSPGSLRALMAQDPQAIVVSDDDIDLTLSDEISENPLIAAQQLVAMVFTSGSTGQPAGHPKHWGTLAERSITAGLRFGLTEETPATILGMVPPQHMYGFETTIMQPWHAACSTWCGDSFYPADVQAGLQHIDAPRWLVTTPLQLRGLLRAELDLPPLRAVLSATAPMDPTVAQAAETIFGTEVLEIFGATECGSIATRRTAAGDIWRLYPGIQFGRDEEGGFLVRTPHAPVCPLADDVEIAPDGEQFRLLGRRGDLIKIGGKRASLNGLNMILNGLLGVEDGVFVPPDHIAGAERERMLVLAQAPGLSSQNILSMLREQIDPVFLPRRVILLDALPRNETGKLPRKALEALLATLI